MHPLRLERGFDCQRFYRAQQFARNSRIYPGATKGQARRAASSISSLAIPIIARGVCGSSSPRDQPLEIQQRKINLRLANSHIGADERIHYPSWN